MLEEIAFLGKLAVAVAVEAVVGFYCLVDLGMCFIIARLFKSFVTNRTFKWFIDFINLLILI